MSKARFGAPKDRPAVTPRDRKIAASALAYDEVIETQGLKLPFLPEIITPKIERAMRNNRYEGGECASLRALLRPGDRVLELGAGVGLCSTIAARIPGVEAVTAVEANPGLLPLIRETHRLNGVDSVDLRNAVATIGGAGEVDFYLRKDFWGASMEPDSRPYTEVAKVPALDLEALLAETRPTVILCDIEGAELDIFADPGLDLSGVRALLMEIHPKVYGAEGVARLTGVLAARGFHRPSDGGTEGSVQVFLPADGPVAPSEGSLMPARAYRSWPIDDPRMLITTCMKDEGPYILEWLAWHRALGVTDLVVFTNDCTDGTAELLDRLQDMGELTHLPNPALSLRSRHFQPRALQYTHYLRAFREADFVISIDVDEFINIRPGAGLLADLFDATGPFDALSISELNHGSNGREAYEPGWVTEQFPRHDSPMPGRYKCIRGVKTITRLSQRVAKIRNHRPDFLPHLKPVRWLDGSGRFLSALQDDPERNGIDVRGTYDLVTLDHYPLRSLNSFLMKMERGDVVVKNKSASQRYWRTRNRNTHDSSTLNPKAVAAARAYHRAHYETDKTLMALHEAACTFHATRIAELLDLPDYIERRAWIMAEAWDG